MAVKGDDQNDEVAKSLIFSCGVVAALYSNRVVFDEDHF